jgi:hypothetical protein
MESAFKTSLLVAAAAVFVAVLLPRIWEEGEKGPESSTTAPDGILLPNLVLETTATAAPGMNLVPLVTVAVLALILCFCVVSGLIWTPRFWLIVCLFWVGESLGLLFRHAFTISRYTAFAATAAAAAVMAPRVWEHGFLVDVTIPDNRIPVLVLVTGVAAALVLGWLEREGEARPRRQEAAARRKAQEDKEAAKRKAVSPASIAVETASPAGPDADAAFAAWFCDFIGDPAAALVLAEALEMSGAVIAGGAACAAAAGMFGSSGSSSFSGTDMDVWVPEEGAPVLLGTLNTISCWRNTSLLGMQEVSGFKIDEDDQVGHASQSLLEVGDRVGVEDNSPDGYGGKVAYSRLARWVSLIHEAIIDGAPDAAAGSTPHSSPARVLQVMELLPGKGVEDAVRCFDLTCVQVRARAVTAASDVGDDDGGGGALPTFRLAGPGIEAVRARATTWSETALSELSSMPDIGVSDWARTLLRGVKYATRGFAVDFAPWLRAWKAWHELRSTKKGERLPYEWCRFVCALAVAVEEAESALPRSADGGLSPLARSLCIALQVACCGDPARVPSVLAALAAAHEGGLSSILQADSGDGAGPAAPLVAAASWWGESLVRSAVCVGVGVPSTLRETAVLLLRSAGAACSVEGGRRKEGVSDD